MMKSSALLFSLFLLINTSAAHDSTLSLHGSGTTNPSKCYWLIMQQMMERTKAPIRMTYRAVGSGTGRDEFIGQTQNTTGEEFVPTNDFGSGDIPISTDEYDSLTSAAVEVAHFPILLGAISVFHSIPNVPTDIPGAGLNLTGCLLARIFRRQITTWDDDDILDLNPNLESYLPSTDFAIRVAHRVLGSSSTASVTEYLHKKCPEEWPIDLVGKDITWPEDTIGCEGSAGMTTCIVDVPGTIGYIDSGHGHEEGLNEIELQNNDGNYITSKDAAANGGIGAAAGAALPGSVFDDFGQVNLLDQPGEFTWPIVAMSYVYVRKNLGHIDAVQEQTLLKAFLKTLYDPSYIGQCVEQFRFSLPPDSVRDVALAAIEELELTPAENETAVEWFFETSTKTYVGQGNYVISGKRRTWAEYERSGNTDETATLGNRFVILRDRIEELKEQLRYLEEAVAQGGGDATAAQEQMTQQQREFAEKLVADVDEFNEDDEQKLTASLVMGSISMVLWALAVAVIGAKHLGGGKRVNGRADGVNSGVGGVAT